MCFTLSLKTILGVKSSNLDKMAQSMVFLRFQTTRKVILEVPFDAPKNKSVEEDKVGHQNWQIEPSSREPIIT